MPIKYQHDYLNQANKIWESFDWFYDFFNIINFQGLLNYLNCIQQYNKYKQNIDNFISEY